jgi:tyrosyl-tRNA synthetase
VASTERTSSTLIAPTVLNNLSWLSDTSLLSFLRFPGKKLKVNVLMTRDSVKSRLASEQGLSFAEFSYQLLQAYDFYMLNRDHGCVLQVGGSDQWGNIISGVELIKQASSPERSLPASSTTTDNTVYGLTIPLLITSNGEKFGKSAGNAIWLDPKLTSVYDFYQVCLPYIPNHLSKITYRPPPSFSSESTMSTFYHICATSLFCHRKRWNPCTLDIW